MNELRDAYIEKLNARLKQWNSDLDKMEAKAKEAKADVRMKYERRVEELTKQRDEIRDKLVNLKDSGADAWLEIRDGIDEAWSALQKSFDRAKAEIV
jgi:DNA repair ATPase RecN